MLVKGNLSNIAPWTWMSLADVKDAIEAQGAEDRVNTLAKQSKLSMSTDLTECVSACVGFDDRSAITTTKS